MADFEYVSPTRSEIGQVLLGGIYGLVLCGYLQGLLTGIGMLLKA